MKKILAVMFLFLLLPFLQAVEFNVNNEYMQGETLITKISGNFIDPPQKENLIFYRDGHVRTPVEYDLQKINNEYYIFVKLPEAQNNYSIVVENVKYYSGSSILEDDLVKEFSTTNSTADFSINPGLIFTETDFSIEVQNLKDNSLTITSTLDKEIQTTNLISGQIESIDFQIKNLNKSELIFLEMKTDDLIYSIPVYLNEETESTTQKKRDFEFDPSQIDVMIATESSTETITYLQNIGEEDLQNITLELSEELEPYVTLSIDEIEELNSGRGKKLTLEIVSDVEEA